MRVRGTLAADNKNEPRHDSREEGGAVPYLATIIPLSALLRREQLVVEVDDLPRANQSDYRCNCERLEELYCGVHLRYFHSRLAFSVARLATEE